MFSAKPPRCAFGPEKSLAGKKQSPIIDFGMSSQALDAKDVIFYHELNQIYLIVLLRGLKSTFFSVLGGDGADKSCRFWNAMPHFCNRKQKCDETNDQRVIHLYRTPLKTLVGQKKNTISSSTYSLKKRFAKRCKSLPKLVEFAQFSISSSENTLVHSFLDAQA